MSCTHADCYCDDLGPGEECRNIDRIIVAAEMHDADGTVWETQVPFGAWEIVFGRRYKRNNSGEALLKRDRNRFPLRFDQVRS